MRRREFITLLGGAAAAWPFAARAQQADRCAASAFLMRLRRRWNAGSLGAFRQGLQQLGWIDGRNVRIDIRWAAAMPTDCRRSAAEWSQLAPDVIVAPQHASALARCTGNPHRANRVRDVVDPVGAGFVESLARPGGNATGFTRSNTT